MSIPAEIAEAVVKSAERGRSRIEEAIRLINSFGGSKPNEAIIRDNYLELAARIAFSHGVDGPKAFQRRLEHLRHYVYGLALSEISGPTE